MAGTTQIRTIVATGATSGIGEKAVEALARSGARILIVARDPRRAEATRARLARIRPDAEHAVYIADLSLMRETRRVGEAIAAQEDRIDVLLNNAGATFSGRQMTAEGLERTFAVNHMAYFVLTAALADRLRAAPQGRIVSTSSSAHYSARLDFDDLQGQRSYGGFRAYGRSKLANILFTRELARRLAGSNVTANCFHPGVVATRFADEAGGWIAPVLKIAKRFAISPERGADTAVYLASDPEVARVSGEYFVRRTVTRPSAAARDTGAARRLWSVSEDLARNAGALPTPISAT